MGMSSKLGDIKYKAMQFISFEALVLPYDRLSISHQLVFKVDPH